MNADAPHGLFAHLRVLDEPLGPCRWHRLDEDDSRARQGFVDKNCSQLNCLILNLQRQDTKLKVGLNAKRKRAGGDPDYLLHQIMQGWQIRLPGGTAPLSGTFCRGALRPPRPP